MLIQARGGGGESTSVECLFSTAPMPLFDVGAPVEEQARHGHAPALRGGVQRGRAARNVAHQLLGRSVPAVVARVSRRGGVQEVRSGGYCSKRHRVPSRCPPKAASAQQSKLRSSSMFSFHWLRCSRAHINTSRCPLRRGFKVRWMTWRAISASCPTSRQLAVSSSPLRQAPMSAAVVTAAPHRVARCCTARSGPAASRSAASN